MKACFTRPLHVACAKYFLRHALGSDTPAKQGRRKAHSLHLQLSFTAFCIMLQFPSAKPCLEAEQKPATWGDRLFWKVGSLIVPFPLESPQSSCFKHEYQLLGSFCQIWSGVVGLHVSSTGMVWLSLFHTNWGRLGSFKPFPENSPVGSPQAQILFVLSAKFKIKMFRQS